MSRTLLVLPNAIGDVICGLGIAHRFLKDGPVVWIVSPSAGGIERILEDEGFECIVPPSGKVKRMADFGVPVEVQRAETKRFLDELKSSGPFARVVNPHFSLASSRIAGAVEADMNFGPAAGSYLAGDTWSDFIASSIVLGVLPEMSVPERYALVARMDDPPSPVFSSRNCEAGETIVFQPGSGWPSKSLPVPVAAAIAEKLACMGAVKLIGSPRESEYLANIRQRASCSFEDFSPGKIESALENICASRLVVTTDTWALHAASACGVPALALCGPTRIIAGENVTALASDEEPSWNSGKDDSLLRLDPSDVILAAEIAMGSASKSELRLTDDAILWRRRSGFMMPHRQLSCHDQKSEGVFFAAARAAAFCELVREYHCDLPVPRTPDLSIMRDRYRHSSDILENLLNRIADFGEAFSLYETTFPGRNADEIAGIWCRRTVELLSAAV